MKLLDQLLAFFNLRRITRTDRAPKRICSTCLHPIKRSGEPWFFAPQFGDNPKHLLPTHRQCPTVPTLPFTSYCTPSADLAQMSNRREGV